jgi:pheromone a factor receptor
MLSGIDLLITIPFNIWVFTAWFPVFPWQSWASLHADFSRVDTYPAAIWQRNPGIGPSLEVTRWIGVAYAFIFFILFGFTDEARERYAFALQFVAKKIGYQTKSSVSSECVISFHLFQRYPTLTFSFTHADLKFRRYLGTHTL